MRILFVNSNFGFFGGVEQTLWDTAMGFRKRGWTCGLAHGKTAKTPDAYAKGFDECFPCIELGATDSKALKADTLVDAMQADVVFMHKVPPELVRDWGVTTVRYVHDHDLYCPRKHKYWVWNGRICHQPAGIACWADLAFLERDPKAALGIRWRAISDTLESMRRNFELDGLYAGSAAMAEMLVTNGCPSERVRIVPPVMQVDLDSPTCEVPKEPRILFVGQLIKGKGVDLLLRALAEIDGDWNCRIIGDGNGRPKLEALSNKLGLSTKVTFEGWLAHEELPNAYDWSRVVAVPSRWPEPFGMVGPEAMARGRAVVAFAVGGIPDWCAHEETGLLAPEADVSTLSRYLKRLLFSADAKTMGLAARKRVEEVFAFPRLLDQLGDALKASVAFHKKSLADKP